MTNDVTNGATNGAGNGRPSLSGLPVNLLLRNRAVVVVGGGRIAARKASSLIEAAALVTVVAPLICDEMRALPASFVAREFEASDIDGAWYVVAATDQPTVNRAVFAAAEARHTFCNSADDPANCSVTLMSVVRQGDLVVAIGSGGRSPALATWLRKHVASEMGPEYSDLLEILSVEREKLRAAGNSSEDADWEKAFESGIIDLVRSGQLAEAEELLRSCL